MKYAFFPGCSLESTARDFKESTIAVCERLGMQLEEIPGWTCCGSSPAHASNPTLAASLPVLNLLKASSVGGDVVTACASCYSRLRAANDAMTRESPVRQKVDQATRAQYRGQTQVRHLLDVLVNDVGLDLIRDYVETTLRGLKVACYYGCLLSRPAKVVAFEDSENPTALDRLVDVLGGEPVEWPSKVECCGAGLGLTAPDAMRQLTFGILDMAEQAGAQCVAVACPLCQSNLDLRQKESAGAAGREMVMPVLYFTQLLGLALGIEPRTLGLDKLIVSPKEVLEHMGFYKVV